MNHPLVQLILSIDLPIFISRKRGYFCQNFPIFWKMMHSVGSKTYPHLVLSVIRNCLVLNASFGLMPNCGLMFRELLVSMKK